MPEVGIGDVRGRILLVGAFSAFLVYKARKLAGLGREGRRGCPMCVYDVGFIFFNYPDEYMRVASLKLGTFSVHH